MTCRIAVERPGVWFQWQPKPLVPRDNLATPHDASFDHTHQRRAMHGMQCGAVTPPGSIELRESAT